MSHKTKLIALAFVVVFLAAFFGYWYYLSPPGKFPNKQTAIVEMMDTFPEADIKEIQDVTFLDIKHVYVPFITNHEGYGSSFWQWEQHEWKFVSIDTGSTPRIWTIDPENPASTYIIWNFHPDNHLTSLTFYLMKERGYSISDGKQNYQPEVEMKLKTNIEDKPSYGSIQLPKEWQDFIISERHLMESQSTEPLFSDWFQPPQYNFGWRSKSKNGSEDYPPYPQNNNGFGTGDYFIEFMRYVDKEDLY
ncbi:hypothetical protein AABM38_12800 [Heyndrickxia sp. MSNUG]|uniref:hypothetical protein n=1 Tax=Heyndrickxia sp. MSNUG TaxID=3136677 RepID=UPI003C2B99E5